LLALHGTGIFLQGVERVFEVEDFPERHAEIQ
jgi:hypothetical protein